jgi:TIR domain-containing protein
MNAPFRILAIAPEPIDAPWSSAASEAWNTLQSALRPAVELGAIEIERLTPATAIALEQRLRQERFDAVHLATRGTSRTAARYGTVTLEGSDRRGRDLNAQNLARLCAQTEGIEVVVLHGLSGAAADLDVTRDTIVQQAAPVITLPPAMDGGQPRLSEFVRGFYTALASGDSLEPAFMRAAGNPSRLPGASAVGNAAEPRLTLRELQARPVRGRPQRDVPPSVVREEPEQRSPQPQPASDSDAAARHDVERKRLAGAFDVFLCHNVADKPAIVEIGRRLLSRGVLPWLDQWELRPGTPWQRVLEEQIANIRSAAVFVGHDGIGPWQRQELDGFLREFNKRGCPVIPVMLPGAGGEPQLPLFLRGMTWVDFRVSDPDPLDQLLWGITGRRQPSW